MIKFFSATLIFLLFTSSLSDLVSLSDARQDDDLPDGCAIAFFGKCTRCKDDYSFDEKGNCVSEDGTQKIQTTEKTKSKPNSENPCGSSSHCGTSKTFGSSSELEEFINKYGSKNIPYIPGGGLLSIDPPFPSRPPQDQPTIFQNLDLGQPRRSFSSSQPASAESFSGTNNQERDFSGTNNQNQNVDEADLLKTDGTYIYTISRGVLSIIRAYPFYKARVLSKIVLKLNPQALFIEGNYLILFGTEYINYQNQQTFVHVYNIKNRLNPFLIKDIRIEGRYFNGRKTLDGFVYLISIANIQKRIKPTPWYRVDEQQNNVKLSSLFLYDGVYQSPVYVNIFAFNLKKPNKNEYGIASIITQRANIMYMSDKHIYLTYHDYKRGQRFTVIHKVFVWRSQIIPFADAVVEGTVNNQFSLDQYDEVLRIATTSQNPTESNVYCLDYFLKEIGHLGNIAPTERIFSARYVGEKLYLVTFRQIDPFFVISLADHRNPTILGELKITGFSRYLHPYDENTIIGFGRQASSTGRQLGLKISVFDVTDVNNPKESASFELKERYASSTAQWEHKAVLFSRQKNLLVIPASYRSGKEDSFNGAFVFYIDKKQISLRGIIDHVLKSTDNFYTRSVQRSLYIQNLLYTKSQCLLKINLISYLIGLRTIEVPCTKIQPKPVYASTQPIFRPINEVIINNGV